LPDRNKYSRDPSGFEVGMAIEKFKSHKSLSIDNIAKEVIKRKG
jgi:hypothetical protein